MGWRRSIPRQWARRVACTSPDVTGRPLVHSPGVQVRVLASNTLDDGFDASAALVDGQIYLRGYRYLYNIAER